MVTTLPRPAIFLDRDGVINANRSDYVKSWAEFAYLPGSLPALVELGRLDWPVVVISNQSAIGRGLLTAETAEAINGRLLEEVRAAGARIDGIYVCPHHPGEGCACRKPEPGLLLQAAAELGLDLARSYLIGDAKSDVLAALRVGAQPVLVLSGRGQPQRARLADLEGKFTVVEDLPQAVAWITSRES